jgi:DNA-binding PadR family transcriptional regulator
MFERHFFGHERHVRFFEKGDLKYIILDLIKDKPSHGYEIIRALEERFHGFYTPSAGSVYPTLQLLEDMGYVKSVEMDGKRTYTITEEGKKYLLEREDVVDKIKKHIHSWGGIADRVEFRDLMNEFKDLIRILKRKAGNLSPENLKKIKAILRQAGQDIEAILNE